jgi:hypothetical protein
MKPVWDSHGMRPRSFARVESYGQPVALAVLLVLVFLPLIVGCSIVQDLPTSTTASLGTDSTVIAQAETTTSLRTTGETGGISTTTTVTESTTTTVPKSTTTTTQEVTTVPTEAPAVTDTTVTTAPADSQAGSVLYEITDWSSGTSGWAAAGQWKTAGGMLVTDGTSDSFAVAPVDLTGYPDYVVEAEVQILDPRAETDVLLMARMINGEGYWGGFDGSARRMVVGYGFEELGGAGFILDSGWHTYRLEVRGNVVKIFFEQAEVGRAVDNRALEPGTVGIYCGDGQINVRSFRVIALQ